MTRVTDFHSAFRALLEQHGHQHWWPADNRFEIMIGAILTQNTAWTNVEKALANLKAINALSPGALATMPLTDLADSIRPSGYFNQKAKRLQGFCRWLQQQGGESALAARDTERLRDDLLTVHGIGPETADDILLYAFDRPVFVIDAYTRRIFSRLGLIEGREQYDELRLRVQSELSADQQLYNEYHALVVNHGKDICRKTPVCDRCLMSASCHYPKS